MVRFGLIRWMARPARIVLAVVLGLWPSVHMQMHVVAPHGEYADRASLAPAEPKTHTHTHLTSDECPVCNLMRTGCTHVPVVARPVAMADLCQVVPADRDGPAVLPPTDSASPRAPPHV